MQKTNSRTQLIEFNDEKHKASGRGVLLSFVIGSPILR